MQKVGIETTQNIRLAYELAGVGDRIAAFLIDIIIIGAYLITSFYLASELNPPKWVFILISLPAFLYHLISEILMNGQSLGKRQLNIKVVKLDGSSPDVGNYLLRWLLWPVDNLINGSVAILTILFSRKGQRLGDIAAGTTVVKFKPRNANLRNQVYAPLENYKDYQLTYSQAEQLTEEQVSVIREALKVYRVSGNSQPVQTLSVKVQELLNQPSDMPPVKYLHTVVKDFEYIHAQA